MSYKNKSYYKIKHIKYTKTDTKERAIKKILKQIKIRIIDDPIKKSVIYYLDKFNRNKETKYDELIINKKFAKRIFLNYIRHNYCNYDYLTKKLDNYNDKDKLFFKTKVNEIILKKYGIL